MKPLNPFDEDLKPLNYKELGDISDWNQISKCHQVNKLINVLSYFYLMGSLRGDALVVLEVDSFLHQVDLFVQAEVRLVITLVIGNHIPMKGSLIGEYDISLD